MYVEVNGTVLIKICSISYDDSLKHEIFFLIPLE